MSEWGEPKNIDATHDFEGEDNDELIRRTFFIIVSETIYVNGFNVVENRRNFPRAMSLLALTIEKQEIFADDKTLSAKINIQIFATL